MVFPFSLRHNSSLGQKPIHVFEEHSKNQKSPEVSLHYSDNEGAVGVHTQFLEGNDVPSDERAYWNGELDDMLVDSNGRKPQSEMTNEHWSYLSPEATLQMWEEEQQELESIQRQQAAEVDNHFDNIEKDTSRILMQQERLDRRSWIQAARIWKTTSDTSSSDASMSESDNEKQIPGTLSVEELQELLFQEFAEEEDLLREERVIQCVENKQRDDQ